MFAGPVPAAGAGAAGTAKDSLAEVSRRFLAELGVPPEARDKLAGSAAESLAARRAVVAEFPFGTYSFAAGKAPADEDEYVRSELEIAEGERQALRARRGLAIYLAGRGGVNRRRYPDDDALSGALRPYYSAAGTQSASEAVGDWVLALVWLEAGAAEAVLSAFPEESSDLDDRYCAFLYERAKRLFESGNYSEALPVFKHIHDFRWANVGAYLDAAECFLRTGESGETLKLLKEVTETLGGGMDSHAFRRAGQLFREAGDRKMALEAFKMARTRLHEGR